MEITKTLTVIDRKAWREWLIENHATETEIWLVYHKKSSGQNRIPYNDAVEEALCFGWIDGIQKTLDENASVQRFTPRRPKSNWSQLNKERVRILLARGQITEAGLKTLPDFTNETFVIPPDILEALQKDPLVWENFERFPDVYKRIRIAFIAEARNRPEMFQQRLAYFLKRTAQNKTFGTTL